MEGRDKTLLRLDPATTLHDALRGRLCPQCAALAISANGDPARFATAGLPVLPDRPGPSRGPLAGVLAGLEHAAAAAPEGWMLTVPGDTPFVPPDLSFRLMAAAEAQKVPVARATYAGRIHALVALWSCRLAEPLRQALFDRDQRKVTAFQAEAGVVDVPWPEGAYDPFSNVNTPADLAEARALQARLVATR